MQILKNGKFFFKFLLENAFYCSQLITKHFNQVFCSYNYGRNLTCQSFAWYLQEDQTFDVLRVMIRDKPLLIPASSTWHTETTCIFPRLYPQERLIEAVGRHETPKEDWSQFSCELVQSYCKYFFFKLKQFSIYQVN